MDSRIPLPTDSLYKFCALFGTLSLIFLVGAFLYANQSKNDLIFSSVVRLSELREIQSQELLSLPEEIEMSAIERKIEIANQDHRFHIISIGIFTVFAIGLCCFGYMNWFRKLQRYQDQMMELEYYKLRREVSKL